MRRPRFLFDVDGVFINFIAGASRKTKELFDIDTTHDQVVHWNFEKSFNLTPEQVAQLIESWREPGFCASLPPYEGAIDAVAEIKEYADVFAVTHAFPSVTWVSERDAALLKYFGLRAGKDIVHTESKFLIDGDVFVDDKVEAAISWQAAHPYGVGVLWHRPYNAGVRTRADAHDLTPEGVPVPVWPGLHTNDWQEMINLAKALRWVPRRG